MDRRTFLKLAGFSSVASTLPASFNLWGQSADYSGKFIVTIQAEGGWDVTSLCDPKMNVAGERKINNWADSSEIQTAGNIRYAPFGNNQTFFDKYAKDMLVINGIDAQTNSHTAGVTHNWSGRISEGFPTLTSLFAAANAPNLPISYVNNGGYAETGGNIRYTRLDNAYSLRNIVKPNTPNWNDNENWVPSADWELIEKLRQSQMEARLAESDLTIREKLAVGGYKSALDNSSILVDFAAEISAAGSLEEVEQGQVFWSSLKRQSQLAILAMKSGVSVAADLYVGGFDTHQTHDRDHGELMTHFTDSIDFFWNYAEQQGLADRIVMVVMSDFSRTPHYNDTTGKDHWPIGSAMVIEKDAAWGNRMVGQTNTAHEAVPINTDTLQPDSENGKVIYPKHVMQSLREYVGVADNAVSTDFQFNNPESFDFFNPQKSTPQAADPRNTIRV